MLRFAFKNEGILPYVGILNSEAENYEEAFEKPM